MTPFLLMCDSKMLVLKRDVAVHHKHDEAACKKYAASWGYIDTSRHGNAPVRVPLGGRGCGSVPTADTTMMVQGIGNEYQQGAPDEGKGVAFIRGKRLPVQVDGE